MYVHVEKWVGERGGVHACGEKGRGERGLRAHGEGKMCVCVCNDSNVKIVTTEDHRTIHLLFPGEDGHQRKTFPGCTS